MSYLLPYYNNLFLILAKQLLLSSSLKGQPIGNAPSAALSKLNLIVKIFLVLLPSTFCLPAFASSQTTINSSNSPNLPQSLTISQVLQTAQQIEPRIPPQDIPRLLRPDQTPPPPTPVPLPSPENLLPKPSIPQPSPEVPSEVFDAVFVRQFEVVGSTVFSSQELTELLKNYTGRNISFAELLQARSAITQLYVKRGYITSAAFIPPQTLENGVIKIQVIEGSLEDIKVTGNRRLNPGYVRSRIQLAASTPVNINRLLERLRLLQLDPLIQNISADLQAGTSPGQSLLQVSIVEAKTLSITPSIDNGRSPSVGTFRRQLELAEANLLGVGDALRVGYTNTEGSNEVNVGYTVPLNPRDGKLSLAYGTTSSRVIEDQFEELDIEADARYYELSYRQPLFQRPTEELALGLSITQQQSQTKLGIDNIGGFPLTPGADEEGRTRVSAVRFFQDWVHRSEREVLAARSQFSFGLDLFDATINDDAPDSRFFAWRGQGQWTRLLAPDTLLLVRGDIQIAGNALVPLEQFSLGGQSSVRGYRQDALLIDSGALFSAELRLPILRTNSSNGVLQVTPFIDIGTSWNNGRNNPNPNTLVGTGLGLLWQQGNLSARIDYGIPLISIDSDSQTLQDRGIYFSIRYSSFF